MENRIFRSSKAHEYLAVNCFSGEKKVKNS
jgi:hypothetical protein